MEQKILIAIKTLIEYFKVRAAYRNTLFQNFDVILQNGNLCLYNNHIDIIFVKKIGVKNYKLIYNASLKPNLIFVYETKTTLETNSRVELFSIDELQTNIFSNFMTSQIRCLSSQELIELNHYYGKNFPLIKKSDKITRYLGCKKGDIICFERSNCLYCRIVE